MSTIAERIKELRKSEGLTQQRFADRLGLKQNTVATYEMGRSIPIDPIITSMCREFGINENWLRHGIGEMKSESTQKQKIAHFFADVLATCPDERSALVAALDDMPRDFWPMMAELARSYVDKLKKEEN